MDVRYGELPLELLRSLFTFEELRRLFLDLVTRLGGDVGEALARCPPAPVEDAGTPK